MGFWICQLAFGLAVPKEELKGFIDGNDLSQLEFIDFALGYLMDFTADATDLPEALKKEIALLTTNAKALIDAKKKQTKKKRSSFSFSKRYVFCC